MMIKLFYIFCVSSWMSMTMAAATAQSYKAEIFNLKSESKKYDFTLDMTEVQNSETYQIKGIFKKQTEKQSEVQLIEEATLDLKTADILEYKIDQKQTGEVGHVQVKDQKIYITYKKLNQNEKKEVLARPGNLVAPANFNQWLQKSFEILKAKKSVVIDFLVWDKLDTYSFKVSYLGEVDLDGKKTHQFKLNINNRLVAAFVDPIYIWYNLPMTQIQQYQGRVAVKLASGPDLKNLDALVKYYH